MNARLYYAIRIAALAVIVVLIPVILLWTRSKLDSVGIIVLSIFTLISVGIIVRGIRKYRELDPGARVDYGPRPEVVRAQALAGSRRMPVVALVIGTVSIVGGWLDLVYEHQAYPVILFIGPVLFLLGLAGTIHPPIFYAMRNDIGEVDGRKRAIAYFLLIVGLAAGGFCAWWVFWR